MTTTTEAPAPDPRLELRPVSVSRDGARPHFSDDLGREVLLRGVNVIGLGDYYQADETLEPTLPVTDADWAAMAALGFDAVRLILSWSALEPTRGTLDEGYLERIHETVDIAASHGIYVILDMHQDAWGKFIATPPGVTCPTGKEAAIGWDGAPEWATITDGADTCREPGQRESSPAVRAAFRSFYDDRDGIRTALSTTWGKLAQEFASEPAVAGYDVLNEPNGTEPLSAQQPKYTRFVVDTIAAIRAGESDAGEAAFHHVVFVEPVVLFPLPDAVPPAGFTDDPDVAFAPHNYWESLVDAVPVEAGMELDRTAAATLDMPFWVGEYGWWDTSDQHMAALRRYAKAEDDALVGSAWWQWRQACGDPHSIGVSGRVPDDQLHLNGQGCPEEADLGLTTAYAIVLSRAYPRAAPGELTSFASDPDAATMTMTGRTGPADDEAPLVVWVPGDQRPTIGGTGVADIEIEPVDGGFLVRAVVGCDYTFTVGAGDASTPPSSC